MPQNKVGFLLIGCSLGVATTPDALPGTEIDLLLSSSGLPNYWLTPICAAARGTRSGSRDYGKKNTNTRFVMPTCNSSGREPEQFTENEPIHRVTWQAKKRS